MFTGSWCCKQGMWGREVSRIFPNRNLREKSGNRTIHILFRNSEVSLRRNHLNEVVGSSLLQQTRGHAFLWGSLWQYFEGCSCILKGVTRPVHLCPGCYWVQMWPRDVLWSVKPNGQRSFSKEIPTPAFPPSCRHLWTRELGFPSTGDPEEAQHGAGPLSHPPNWHRVWEKLSSYSF